MARDYYEVLSVSRNASKDEIKKSFRTLARKYHPDVSTEDNAEQKFKEINEAYEVLSDDQKRQQYDRFGHAGVSGAGAGGFNGTAGFGGFEDIFEDFFSSFVGRQGGTRSASRRGSDIRVDVNIAFEEAAFGIDKEIQFHRLEVCDVCEGSGAREGSHPITCPDCKGAGEVRQVRQTFVGSVVRVAACPRCGGKGKIIENPCTNCDGSGRRRRKTKLSVKIPAGVHDGLRIQVRGEGDAGEKSAQSGDMYVVIHVTEHEFFKRRDSDIILDVSVNVAQAALGDKVQIPTLEGDVEMVIPAGTQTGKVFRLKGKGVPRLRTDGTNSGRGDQMVYVTVEVPSKLTESQRKLFEELGESLGNQITPQSRASGKGFFSRVMDFLGGEQ
ncbi:MAG: molecular chaperone DnaJ [Anaerolineae bacterium]|nr:molecular chaperone DnaJ [Anaerolineae bacterium]